MTPPKAILFDIGGVCVLSPFQGILDFEKENSIPIGWINHAISASKPDGAWHRMERGELSVNEEFYHAFDMDLHNETAWRDFRSRRSPKEERKTLQELANPTQLGDPVSLKAEAADSEPTDQDRGAGTTHGRSTDDSKRPSLKDLAKKNPSMLGDPVSLKAEAADSEPTDQDKGAASTAPLQPEPGIDTSLPKTSSSSQRKSLKDAAQENPSQLGDPVSLKAETSSTPDSASRRSSGSSKPPPLKDLASKNRTLVGDPTSLKAETSNTPQPSHANAAPSSSSSSPSMPQIDTRLLFPQILSHSQTLDPNIHPYLQTLRQSNRFVLGALSNTIPTPLRPPPPSSSSSSTPTPQSVISSTPATSARTRAALEEAFDFFIASSEVGMRKPEAKIYEHAMGKVKEAARAKGMMGEVRGADVVFLDDIGENLKAAGKVVGWRTIKVELGRTGEAVARLEEWTGVRRTGRSKL